MTAEEDKKSVTDSVERPDTGDMGDIRTETPININIALYCTLKGKVERFIQCFEDEKDEFHDTVTELVNQRGDDGKSPLDMAATLGRVEMVKELITRGSEVCAVSSQGYSALHHAAAWGKVDCLKALVDNGAELQQKTAKGERAKEISVRYGHSECVDFLDWAESKQALQEAIQLMRDTLTDPEKVQGKLTREDKNVTSGICNEKSDWIENTPDATTSDFIAIKQEFEDSLSYIWQKINEPLPEKAEKK